MDEEDRKLALKQANGVHQKAYVKEILRGPVKFNRWWLALDSDIGEESRASVDMRLQDAGFRFDTFTVPSGNKYRQLFPPKK